MATIIAELGSFSESLDFDLPVSSGCEYFNFFRGGAAVVDRNLVRGKASASTPGTPAYGAGYARLTAQSNYIQTAAPDTSQFTWIHVGRGIGVVGEDATRPVFLGCAQPNPGGGVRGASLNPFNPSEVNAYTTVSNGGAMPVSRNARITDDPAQWGFRVIKITGTDIEVSNLTTGASAVTALTFTRGLSTACIQIGSQPNTSWTGVSDVSCAAIYSRALSSGEISAVYGRMKAVAALDGITV